MRELVGMALALAGGVAVATVAFEVAARWLLTRADRRRWRREGLHTWREVADALDRIYREEHARG